MTAVDAAGLAGTLRFDHQAELALQAAERGGATEAEAFFRHGTELVARAHDGAVESLTSAETKGVGLRVFRDHRMGFAHTSDLSPEGLGQLVDRALDACRYNEPDESNGLPDTEPAEPLDGLVAGDFDERPIAERASIAVELERAAVAARGEVVRTAGSVYGDERGHTEIHSTAGRHAAFSHTVAYAYVESIAERGDEMQSGFSLGFGRSASQLDVGACAEEAAERAVRMLGAERLTSRTAAVVLEPWAAASLVGTLSSSISAEAVQKSRSLLAGRIGEPIASSCVTLLDDGRRADGLASRAWDDEGVPTHRTTVIDGGVLRSYLHNTYTARRDGSARSTGNATRGSYRSSPELGPTNLMLAPGTASLDELLARMGDGLLVTDVHGLHTINPVTGEFSLGINGLVVEGGTPAAPVREMTVAGTLLELLARVEAVGSDLRFMIGSGFVGSPSLLVAELAVSGA